MLLLYNVHCSGCSVCISQKPEEASLTRKFCKNGKISCLPINYVPPNIYLILDDEHAHQNIRSIVTRELTETTNDYKIKNTVVRMQQLTLGYTGQESC